MDLKNITMDDLKAKFATIDKKTLIKFGSGFGAVSYTHLTLPTIYSV